VRLGAGWSIDRRARAKRNGVLSITRRTSPRRGVLFPSSACKFLLSRACPTDGKLEQIRFQFWIALSFGEPCAIFGSFQTLSRMFRHNRTVSAGAIQRVLFSGCYSAGAIEKQSDGPPVRYRCGCNS
jgi:hypothetical protein